MTDIMLNKLEILEILEWLIKQFLLQQFEIFMEQFLTTFFFFFPGLLFSNTMQQSEYITLEEGCSCDLTTLLLE